MDTKYDKEKKYLNYTPRVLEYHSVYPLSELGPLVPKGGGHTLLRMRGWVGGGGGVPLRRTAVPEFIDPRFRENKPKRLIFSH